MTSPLPVLATCLWLFAFFCSFSWLSSLEAEFTALSVVGVICALSLSDASGIKSRLWPVPCSPVLIAGGLFWLLTLLSIATSELLLVSWIYFVCFSLLPLSVAFFLVGEGVGRRLELARRGLVAILGGLALYALYQFLFRPDLLVYGRVHFPMVDPNGLAAVFSLGAFLALPDLLKAEGKGRLLFGLYLLLLVCGLLVTGSRAGFLAFGVMGLVFIAAIGVRRIPLKVAGSLVVAGFALLFGLTLWAGEELPLLDHFNHSLSDAMGTRPGIWTAALTLVERHLWLGTGMGSFYYYYPELRPAYDTTAGYMVHNDPLQFAVEAGVGAFLLFYVVVTLAVMRTLKTCRRIGRGGEGFTEIIACFCGLGAMLLHAHLNFNFHLLPCLMLAGYALARWHHATDAALDCTPVIVRAPGWCNDLSLKALFLIVAFAFSVLAAAPIYAQGLVGQAARALARGDLPEFAHRLNTADVLSGRMSAQSYLLAAKLPLSALQQSEVTLPEIERSAMAANAHRLLEQSIRYNPRDAEAYTSRAALFAIEGNMEAKLADLREALRINPLHLPARMMLADHYASLGDATGELDVLRGGMGHTYRPDFASLKETYYRRTITAFEAAGLKDEAALAKTHAVRPAQ